MRKLKKKSVKKRKGQGLEPSGGGKKKGTRGHMLPASGERGGVTPFPFKNRGQNDPTEGGGGEESQKQNNSRKTGITLPPHTLAPREKGRQKPEKLLTESPDTSSQKKSEKPPKPLLGGGMGVAEKQGLGGGGNTRPQNDLRPFDRKGKKGEGGCVNEGIWMEGEGEGGAGRGGGGEGGRK